MSETPAPTDPAAAPAAPAPKKKGKGKLVPILMVVLLLGGGGGGAYWYFVARPAAAAAAPAEPEEPEATGVIKFEPFVVNLADPGATRFLRINLALVVKDDVVAKEVEENAVLVTRIRSEIIELLAQQTSDVLVTPDGKTALKKSIKEHVIHVAHEAEVADVLFSEFVVQF